MNVLKIKTNDDRLFEIAAEVIYQSKVIKNMIDDMEDAASQEIPLSTVDGPTLELIIKFCEHHKDDKPLPEEETPVHNSEDIEEWDREFAKIETDALEKLILAANYLDIPKLFTLCCKTIANIVKGKKVEEIREYFGIPNDWAPGEEEETRKTLESSTLEEDGEHNEKHDKEVSECSSDSDKGGESDSPEDPNTLNVAGFHGADEDSSNDEHGNTEGVEEAPDVGLFDTNEEADETSDAGIFDNA